MRVMRSHKSRRIEKCPPNSVLTAKPVRILFIYEPSLDV